MAAQSKLALPDLFLIGAPKAGTTSIACWLADHPDVYWSVPKEPFFWAADYPALRRHYGIDTREAYDRLFSSPEAAAARVRGDGSTCYLYSVTAVPDIAAAQPEARFVVCVRNPVDLIASYHRTQLIALNEDEPELERAWSRSVTGRLPGVRPLDPKLVDYPLVGSQGGAVARVVEQVGRQAVHLICFDDLVENPHKVWHELADFAGLPATPLPDFRVRNPSDKTYRSLALRQVMHRPPRLFAPGMRRLRAWSRTTRLPGVAGLKRALWRSEERPHVTESARATIASALADDVELLGQLLGRDLTHWSRSPVADQHGLP
ncbi:MAG: hypothetical protein AVDCRST_MAG34-1912 [uncultured Nocardioidaceae bacterium]|uniref:Sulfotransferase domain-containing protein n=1 Tax=uncultured Nocardioidaceae bacterium TaxID=253824 RepID=A0A6J4MF18_9ACTN|nr:MAG: hypothetical protein AVDCRST_MAG34-1912 [uncultured Nocardioidaceae bacterium]